MIQGDQNTRPGDRDQLFFRIELKSHAIEELVRSRVQWSFRIEPHTHARTQERCVQLRQQNVARFFHLPFSLVVNPTYLYHHFRLTALDPTGSDFFDMIAAHMIVIAEEISFVIVIWALWLKRGKDRQATKYIWSTFLGARSPRITSTHLRWPYPPTPITLNIANIVAKIPILGTAIYVFQSICFPPFKGHIRRKTPSKRICRLLKATPELRHRPSNRNTRYSNTYSNTPKSWDSSVEFLLSQTPDCRQNLIFLCSGRPQQVPSTEFSRKLLVSAPMICTNDALQYVLLYLVDVVANSAIVADRLIHSPFWRSSPIGRCTFAGPGRHESQTLRTKITVKYNTS